MAERGPTIKPRGRWRRWLGVICPNEPRSPVRVVDRSGRVTNLDDYRVRRAARRPAPIGPGGAAA